MKKLLVYTLPIVFCCMVGFSVLIAPGAANAAIVNIDAMDNTITNPVTLFLETNNAYVASGIPTPDWIGDDAWNAWLAGGAAAVNVTESTPYAPGLKGWLNRYFIEVDGVHHEVWDGLLHPDAATAFASIPDYMFSVMSDSTVRFYIDDSYHADNTGGISVEVSQVPIPGALWLLGTGLIGLAGVRKRFKS